MGKTTKAETTALAVKDMMENPEISQMRVILEHAKEKIQTIKTSSYNTGETKIEGVIISKATDKGQLRLLASRVIARKEALSKADEILGWETVPVDTIEGFSAEKILEDIQLRARIIDNKVWEDKIKQYSTALEELMSREDKLKLTMQNMAKDFGLLEK